MCLMLMAKIAAIYTAITLSVDRPNVALSFWVSLPSTNHECPLTPIHYAADLCASSFPRATAFFQSAFPIRLLPARASATAV